jgi:hypothetical protein
MLCVAAVRVGPARQCFWAIWDRARGELHERTRSGRRGVELSRGRAVGRDRTVQFELALAEVAGIETVSWSGDTYAWTRKQGGVAVAGTVMIEGRPRRLTGRGLIDDTAAYYPRHTRWLWAAGVGLSTDGRELAWNLVDGVNDSAEESERSVWVDGVAFEPPPCTFAPDLTGVDGLRFHAEAERRRVENRLLVRSSYRQPFGTYSGVLPGGIELAEGDGVMELHDAHW